MSFLGGMGIKEVSTTQILSLVTDRFYDRFEDIKDFPEFYLAILDIFRTINAALPGKHYYVPSQELVEKFFEENWKKASDDKGRKEAFTKFMKNNVHINKADESMIITAIVAPPAAMVVKRTGQTLPQLKLMKSVPDVVFVPSFTVVALIAVKIARMLFMKKSIKPTTKDDEHQEHPSPSKQKSIKPNTTTNAVPADDKSDNHNNNSNNKNKDKHKIGYCEECGVVHA
ncbi:hypothetical protein PIB30_087368 [Stylosanthes scabra]|uniref:Calcium ion binding protein n=1 Tax=Stylosanthes scabra TaxID=79078 RepID=A0ABU6WTE7_9FABA|nr:hypothetical protein [Stylosanthes scabra]